MRKILALIFLYILGYSISSFASNSDYNCSLKQFDNQQLITTATAAVSRGACAAANMNGDVISFCVTNNLGYRLGVSVFNTTSRLYLMSAEQKLHGPISASGKNPPRFEFIKRDFNLHIICDRSDEFALLTGKEITK